MEEGSDNVYDKCGQAQSTLNEVQPQSRDNGGYTLG